MGIMDERLIMSWFEFLPNSVNQLLLNDRRCWSMHMNLSRSLAQMHAPVYSILKKNSCSIEHVGSCLATHTMTVMCATSDNASMS